MKDSCGLVGALAREMIQQTSLADCKKINEEHFDLQHISSIFTGVFVVS